MNTDDGLAIVLGPQGKVFKIDRRQVEIDEKNPRAACGPGEIHELKKLSKMPRFIF